MRSKSMKTLGALILFLVCLVVCRALHAHNPPHIVFFMADDLGWSDVSFHGSKQIPTPNIDVIARDGIILNQHYVQPLCSPSRAALFTAKYPIRTGLQNSVILAPSPWGLPLTEKLLPQYLKDLNYSTHAIGKWHLGFFQEEYLPTNRGFDTFFGYYSGREDYFSHVAIENGTEGLDLHKNDQPAWEYNGTYGTQLFTEKATEVIREHDPKKPLFLYVAQQAPHSGNPTTFPIQVLSDYLRNLVDIKDETRKLFAGMVSALDESVGEIFVALEERHMLDNTIFIFTSDNGGAVQGMEGTTGSNWPLRGAKNTLWEGGVRSVAFVWSPFLRQHSRVHNGLMHITDWLPTILSAAGGYEAVDALSKNVDGVDQWPTLTKHHPSPRKEVLLNINDVTGISGIRRGRFKLVNSSNNTEGFDLWYDIEGKLITESSNDGSVFKCPDYFDNYLHQWDRSKAVRLLQKKYGTSVGQPYLPLKCTRPPCQSSVLVHCGSDSYSDSCNPQGSCLFDVVNDPCEFNNLIETLPDVAAKLQDIIDNYRKVMIPPANKPADPAADPALHGNVWEPWM